MSKSGRRAGKEDNNFGKMQVGPKGAVEERESLKRMQGYACNVVT